MRVRALTEGAMLAALTVVFTLVGMFLIPPLMVLLPVPLVILIHRHGVAFGLVGAVAAGLAAFVALPQLGSLLQVVITGLTGTALGWAFRRRLRPLHIVAVGSIGAMASLLVGILLARLLFGINQLDELLELMGRSLEVAPQIWSRLGVPPEQIESQQRLLEQATAQMGELIPVLLLGSAVLTSAANFAVARAILRRLGEAIDDVPAFARWRIPASLIVGYVGGQVLMIWGGTSAQPLLSRIGLNLFFGFGLVYGVGGLALLWYWLDRVRVPKLLRLLGAYLALLYLFPLVALAGVFDSLFDFRKLVQRRPDSP